MNSSKIGVIGLGAMGKALSRNLASRGYKVSVWNRTSTKINDFVSEFGDQSFYAPNSFEDFIESLERPRKVIVMLPANRPSQQMFSQLISVLEPGDFVMDGANAVFKVTEINERNFTELGIHFLGVGVSGGEEGALRGPSMMPGGSQTAWEAFEPILRSIAAEDFSGAPCVSYMGKAGAGHYVKMVHNGIEYAEMQALAEAYELLRRIYRISHEEIADIFQGWNEGPLGSFLTEISVDVLRKKEEGKDLLDLIVDQAGQKGTGRWTAQEGLELGVPIPSIAASVSMRGISMDRALRGELSQLYPRQNKTPQMTVGECVAHLEKTLLAARLSHFEQGLALLREADQHYKMGLNIPEILRVWQGGCIIRNQMLKAMHGAVSKAGDQSLYFSDFGRSILLDSQKSWRLIVQMMTEYSVPNLVIASGLNHFEAYRNDRMSANFLQGLRDRFGSHGYECLDKEGSFHSNWS